jgi:radical SAM protein with 4Fe4S-binding SPASM domain
VKKRVKPGRATKPTSEITNAFELPRTIAHKLRAITEEYTGRGAPPEIIKYLWINVTFKCSKPGCDHRDHARELNWEDWLNVVDEAAALGVQYLIVCTGETFQNYPDVWKICHWAQSAHGIEVGIHTYAQGLRPAEVDEITRLDPNHTWFFVKRENLSSLRFLEDYGIKVIEGEVDHEEHSPPCDMPESMVFVGPGGTLYACGLVLDNEEFKLGHVAEQPLARILSNPSARRHIPDDVAHHEHGCDACPPLMAKRMKAGR